MDDKTLEIYKAIFNNSILFLKRGIDEIINSAQELTKEQFVVSCLFIHTSLELGLKAFLVKEKGIKTILKNGHQNQTVDSIFNSFENNDLRTKTYNDLKKLILENEITLFGEIHFEHLTRFQKFRNNLVHLNLSFSSTDLQNLKYESIFAIVHLIIPLLSEIDFENETPSEFYAEYLDDHQYKKLISFPHYIEEMEKVAKKFTGYAYECPECYTKTFSPGNGICYCCNLNFIDAAEYVNCKICNAENAVIFDSLNIELNGDMINGLCLNCGDKPNVFKCPHCECKQTFYGKDELKNSCFDGCKN
jgi:hypothetical protein